MKLLFENWRKYLNEAVDWEAEAEKTGDEPAKLETVGDLRNILDKIILAKRTEGGLGALKDIGLGAVLDLVPGASTAKTVYDVFQSTYNLPDDKKTNTALDKLNVDDQVSAVVDDTVENAFLKGMKSELEGLPDEQSLEELDMTKMLSNYISAEFEKTVVTGAGL